VKVARAVVLVLVATSVATAAPAPAAAVEPAAAAIAWTDDLARAIATAHESGRPVLTEFWAVWCAPCLEMERTTWADPGVIERTAAFVALKVDGDLHPGVMERYGVAVLPALLVLDGAGDEMGRIVGFVSADELRPILDVLRERYPTYREALERTADPDAVETVSRLLLALGNARRAVEHTKRAVKAGTDRPPEDRARLDVSYAEALVAAGRPKPAQAIFERLVASDSAEAVRARALVGSVRAARARGDAKAETAALDRLAREFPDVAAP